MNQHKIGEFLYKLRKEHKLTQQEVADKLYLTREAVSKWERGICLPDYQTMMILCKIYDISINELLYGELENDNNKEALNEAPLKEMINLKHKNKVVINKFVSIIVILLLSFFIYYFVNNYKSIRVYVIAGEGKYFDISQGMLITSPNKTYLQLGEIINFKNTEEEIKSITLYYIDNNKKQILLEDNDIKQLIVNVSTDSINKKNINKVLDNLYAEIKSEELTEIIKLNFKMNFENDLIINKDENQNIEVNVVKSRTDNVLDKFTLEDDKYIYKTNNYTYELNEDNDVIGVLHNGKLIAEYLYELDIIRIGNVSYNAKKIDITLKSYEKDKKVIDKVLEDLL